MENRFKVARTLYNQHGPQSVKDVEIASGITKSLIEDLESNAGKPRDVGYLKVKKLAEYYGVSSDFLLGVSNTPSIEEDIQLTCKTTGLSEAAVKTLIESSEIKGYDYLLTSNAFKEFVELITMYKHYIFTMKMDDIRHDLKKEEAVANGHGYIDLRLEWKRQNAERRGIKADLIEAVFKITEEIDEKYAGGGKGNGKH